MKRDFQPCVYLLASHRNGTLYCGVTSDLMGRLWQHREEVTKGFGKDHGIKRLMWFEQHATMESAILREKQIKKWNRAWKVELLEKGNPDWRDLAVDLGFDVAPSHRLLGQQMDSRFRGNDEREGDEMSAHLLPHPNLVIPAKAGIQLLTLRKNAVRFQRPRRTGARQHD